MTPLLQQDNQPPLGPAWLKRARQAAGLVALAVFLLVALTHFAELDRLWSLVRAVRPGWLLAALVLQVGGLACVPLLWWQVLRVAGAAPPLWRVLPLGLAKLFVDHVVPSGGVSGSAAVVSGLVRRGVQRPLAMAAVLADFVSYFLGYSLAVGCALLVFWSGGHLRGFVWALLLPYALLAVGVPWLIFRLCSDRRGFLTRRLARHRTVARLLAAFERAPLALVRGPASLLPGAALRFLVFGLNAATLLVLLWALGQKASLAAAFAAVVVGTLATTLGPVPGGVGSFEAATTATLMLLAVPAEEALAGTLLLRGLTFWAPMLPGLFVVRAELQPDHR
jgi:uncharacterized protein (TIRG00374 family)